MSGNKVGNVPVCVIPKWKLLRFAFNVCGLLATDIKLSPLRLHEIVAQYDIRKSDSRIIYNNLFFKKKSVCEIDAEKTLRDE